MSFVNCVQQHKNILMEGALGERLKREYNLPFDPDVAMARLIYRQDGQSALKSLWLEYINIAKKYHLPFLATTPTRRANQERVMRAHGSPAIILDNVKAIPYNSRLAP